MPRIRTIKPEFWSSPGIEELDPKWRLLFIAMWQWADDYGRGTCEPRELMGFAFPRDENMTLGEFRRGLGGIHRVFGVKFYHFSKRPYYSIPTWEKHQKIDKRAKGSKFPDPDDGIEFDPANGQVVAYPPEHSEEPIEDSGEPSEVSGNYGAGTGEQGNRGTDRKRSCSSDDERESKASTYPQAFEEWWAAYPKKVGKRKALNEWRRAIKRIDNPTLIAKTEEFAAFHAAEGTDKQFIKDPQGWLSRDGWDDELISRTPHQDTNTINSWLTPQEPTQDPDTIDGEVVPSWHSKGELPW